jgi:hypothetical protein
VKTHLKIKTIKVEPIVTNRNDGIICLNLIE